MYINILCTLCWAHPSTTPCCSAADVAAVHAGDQSSGQLIILFALYTHLFSLNAPKSSLNAVPMG